MRWFSKNSALSDRAAECKLFFDQRNDVFASHFAVFLGVKDLGVLFQIGFDTVTECDAKLSCKIDLADTAGNGFLYGFFRNTGRSMQDQRNGHTGTNGA